MFCDIIIIIIQCFYNPPNISPFIDYSHYFFDALVGRVDEVWLDLNDLCADGPIRGEVDATDVDVDDTVDTVEVASAAAAAAAEMA